MLHHPICEQEKKQEKFDKQLALLEKKPDNAKPAPKEGDVVKELWVDRWMHSSADSVGLFC